MAVTMLALIAGPSAVSGQMSRVSKPFFVAKDEDAHTVVKLKTKAQREFSCQLSHGTGSGEEATDENAGSGGLGGLGSSPEQQVFQAVHSDVETRLATLDGICIRKTGTNAEYWTYELCFRAKVTQSHGRNAFLLGTYVGMDGLHQLYDEGTRCEALAGNVGRESRVELVCDKAFRLLSVTEVSTCSYMIYVSTPIVCGHPQYKQSLKSVPGMASASNAGPPRDEWVLEIAELADGQVVCSAAALDPSSRLRFKNFELSLYVSTPSVELKTAGELARTYARQSLIKSEGHYEVRRVEDNTKISMVSGKSFQGGLTFALVQAAAEVL